MKNEFKINNLSEDKYLFSPELHLVLKKGKALNLRKKMLYNNISKGIKVGLGLLNIISKLIISGNLNKMSNLIDLVCRKLHFSFVDEVLQNFESYKLFNINRKEEEEDKNCNILKGCIFI